MNRMTLPIALLACMPGAVAFAMNASDTDGPAAVRLEQEARRVSGKIESLQLDQNRFTLTQGDRQMVVNVTSSTVYELDGDEARREEVLKVGRSVTVTHNEGIAAKVEARSEQ